MGWWIEVQNTYFLLLCAQAAHLFHHRLAKRHISFAEVIAGAVLCVRPGTVQIVDGFLPWVHLGLAAVQIVERAFITKLSPDWNAHA